MAKRFWFSLENGDEAKMFDHVGNIRGARAKAQKEANRISEAVFINCCETEDIFGCYISCWLLN